MLIAFQSIHPVWDGTGLTVGRVLHFPISIHPSRVGWDLYMTWCLRCVVVISIHPSRVGWDHCRPVPDPSHSHFNPPIPCGMGLVVINVQRHIFRISIHPSRVGWDEHRPKLVVCPSEISIHPSRVGWDRFRQDYSSPRLVYFNPPIPCGMGRRRGGVLVRLDVISIHPSRVGWDDHGAALQRGAPVFQSTHPVWDGTWRRHAGAIHGLISIHPSRVGWDMRRLMRSPKATDFNPPIPCGMGRTRICLSSSYQRFQSTHPVWDGTITSNAHAQVHRISIHPSRVGWDQNHVDVFFDGLHFNPPIPCGMGPAEPLVSFCAFHISIHPSRVGWDCPSSSRANRVKLFQSTHPVWDGTAHLVLNEIIIGISIHPSRVGWDLLF